MVEAFVLITCDYGQEEKILEELDKIEEIQVINRLGGPYNILVKINSETIDEINEIVTGQIKTIDKIRHTLTLKIKTD
jgi:DNA-binding Lrp family transcriptional regulator